MAIQTAIDEGQAAGHLVGLIAGGIPLVFGLWWLYFSRENTDVMLGRSITLNMIWGSGHYFVFASAAAVGAGLAVRVDHYAHHSASAGLLTAGSVTVPTAVLVASIYVFHVSQHDRSPLVVGAFATAVVVVLLGTVTPVPELVAGLTCAVLVGVTVVRRPGAPLAARG
ncbi:MAG: low temperature requirement protein A [Nocardioidaceae bacterium]